MTDTTAVLDPTSQRYAMRRRCVWLLYGVTAFWGVAQVAVSESAAIYMLAAFLLASAATCWAILDGRITGNQMPAIIPLVYFLLWPLASLAYLVWTRKWLGLCLWTLHFAGLIATLVATFYPTAILMYSFGLINVAPDGTIQTGG